MDISLLLVLNHSDPILRLKHVCIPLLNRRFHLFILPKLLITQRVKKDLGPFIVQYLLLDPIEQELPVVNHELILEIVPPVVVV